MQAPTKEIGSTPNVATVARKRRHAVLFPLALPCRPSTVKPARSIVLRSGAVTALCCGGGEAVCGFARRARVETYVQDAPGNPKPGAPQFYIYNVNA